MKGRIAISALIFIVLCSAKIFFPENAAKVRSVVLPAINRETSVREDCIAIGKAISGEEDAVNVWERLTGQEKVLEDSPAPATPSPTQAKAAATGEFSLPEMVTLNLKGYEELPGLPVVESPTPESLATPSPSSPPPSSTEAPSPQPSAPTAEVAVSAELTIAPDIAPVESSAPASKQSLKIDEFLKEQAAFSDYTMPANVSYEAPVIPFEYSDPCSCAVTSGFGYREHPLDGGVKFHYGTDLGAIDGTDVLAFADGKVLSVQELDGYGNTVLIDHGDGFTTLYAHLSQTLVKQGAAVKRGDKIALSGHTGKVTGPHLHFEIIFNGKYLNPEFYL